MILLATGPDETHLFIVITPPADAGDFVIAPLSTLRPHNRDKACILDPADWRHPFLKAPSLIRYDLVRAVTAEMLAKAEAAGLARLRPYERFPIKAVRFIRERAEFSELIEERFEERIKRYL